MLSVRQGVLPLRQAGIHKRVWIGNESFLCPVIQFPDELNCLFTGS